MARRVAGAPAATSVEEISEENSAVLDTAHLGDIRGAWGPSAGAMSASGPACRPS
jgi:hypothetical protein